MSVRLSFIFCFSVGKERAQQGLAVARQDFSGAAIGDGPAQNFA
jgi:hypothetical protein